VIAQRVRIQLDQVDELAHRQELASEALLFERGSG
jgi:hypothetical protein